MPKRVVSPSELRLREHIWKMSLEILLLGPNGEPLVK